ncbi:serine-arginine protein 55 [Anthonomus grandis grandis]|uniref:serine-arginine protein 55 n=1 Tax=Anthonomus grandis grandis TaxID=2921223 RepID=UPI002166B559|nr:serine-arginine protein 55 [Anthonomus grandis grandis]
MVGSRVYIGGLPYGTNERDLERFFRGYGRMREVTLKSGYGFVEFDDYRDADDAVYELNGKRIQGERVTVERARGTPRGRDRWADSRGSSSSRGRDRDRNSGRDRYGPPTRTAHRVIIENLSSRVSWQDLKDYMRQAGEVTYADAHRDHKNEGVVEFASRSDMKKAIEQLDDTELNGRRIRVVEDKSKSRRRGESSSRSRSRSRSRSGSKSRSKSRSKSKENKASRSRSRSNKRSRSRSASREAKKAREDRSRSRSKTNGREDRSKSREDDREERSKSREDRSRSRSKENGHRSRSGSRERSKSREPSKERSRSRSRSKSN